MINSVQFNSNRQNYKANYKQQQVNFGCGYKLPKNIIIGKGVTLGDIKVKKPIIEIFNNFAKAMGVKFKFGVGENKELTLSAISKRTGNWKAWFKPSRKQTQNIHNGKIEKVAERAVEMAGTVTYKPLEKAASDAEKLFA